MGRSSLTVALAVAGALAAIVLAACGGGGSTTTGGATLTNATPVVAPAIPCSSSSGKQHRQPSKTTTTPITATTNTSTTPSGTTWTGVFERVTAHLENDGSVKKTPRQFTRVTVEGNSPVTVSVPMSDKGLRKRGTRNKKPSFSNGMAQIALDPNGSKTEQLDSDFENALPVAVKITYKLNGKPVSASDLKHKSGTVQASYRISNTTSRPVTVCFKGFNGETTKQTVNTPHPLIAYFSFTVPKTATTFHAPGASLAPAKKGVGVSWTTAMFPPLGDTTQTFTLTMTTSKAELPKTHLLLETLNPLSPTGAAPQKSAAAVGEAAATADTATAKVQSDIAALQAHEASKSSSKSSSRSKSSRSSRNRGASPSPAATASALTSMRKQVDILGQANVGFIANVNRPTRTLFGTTRGSIDGMAGTASRTIDDSTRNVDRVVRHLNAGIDRSLGGFTTRTGRTITVLKADLRRAMATPSLLAITASANQLRLTATDLRHHADAVAAEVAPIAAQVDELVSGLQTPVQSSTDLVRRLAQVKADLDGVNGIDKNDPTIIKLVADVVSAQKVAGDVNAELTDLEQKAQAVAAEVHTLQTDVVALQNQVTALEAAALANAEGTVRGQLAKAVAGLDARFAAAEANAAREVANAEAAAVHAVQADGQSARKAVAAKGAAYKRTIGSARSNAQDGLTSAVRKAQRKVLRAERSVTETLTSVQEKADRALAEAKQRAKAGGQASLAAAQAAAAKAAAAVGAAVDKANADYARLLTTNEVAYANQLPGGDVPGATEQNGSFRYVIKGT